MYKLLFAIELHIKKSIKKDDCIYAISQWVEGFYRNNIKKNGHELTHLEPQETGTLTIKSRDNCSCIFAKYDKLNNNNQTWRVELFFDLNNHVTMVLLFVDSIDSVTINPPNIVEYLLNNFVDEEYYLKRYVAFQLDITKCNKAIFYSNFIQNIERASTLLPIVISNYIPEEKKKYFKGSAYLLELTALGDIQDMNGKFFYSLPTPTNSFSDVLGGKKCSAVYSAESLKDVKLKIYEYNKERAYYSDGYKAYYNDSYYFDDNLLNEVYELLSPKQSETTYFNEIKEELIINKDINKDVILLDNSIDNEEPKYEEEEIEFDNYEKESQQVIKRFVYINSNSFQKLIKVGNGQDERLKNSVLKRLTDLATQTEEDLKNNFIAHHYEKLKGEGSNLASLCAKSHKDSYRILFDYEAYKTSKKIKIVDFGPHEIYDNISKGYYDKNKLGSYYIFDPIKCCLTSTPYLSKNQVDIAHYQGCPTLTEGCAGSGKTTISIEKYVWLNDQGKDNLIYLTYNENLKRRIENELAFNLKNDYSKVNVRTIRGFFEEIIKKYDGSKLLEKTIIDFSGSNNEKKILDLIKDYNSILKMQGKKNPIPKNLRKLYNLADDVNEFFASFVHSCFRGIYKGGLFGFTNNYELIEKDFVDSNTIFSNMLSGEEQLDADDKDYLYNVCKYINEYLISNNYIDDNDLSWITYKIIVKAKSHYSIIIDETQDLTERQIFVISTIAYNSQLMEIHFYADPNQTINPTILDLNKIDSCFQLIAGRRISIEKRNENYTYRINDYMATFINHLIELRKNHIGHIDNKNDGHIIGQPVTENSTYGALVADENLVDKIIYELENGNLTLLVTDDFERNNFINRYNITNKNAVYTISDFKGQEDEYVAVYNFIGYNKQQLSQVFAGEGRRSTISRYIFNRLFVAFTRAKNSIILIEPDYKNNLNIEEFNTVYSSLLYDENQKGIITIVKNETILSTYLPGEIDDDARRQKSYKFICEGLNDRGIDQLYFVKNKNEKDKLFINMHAKTKDINNMAISEVVNFYRQSNQEPEYLWEANDLFKKMGCKEYILLTRIMLKSEINEISYRSDRKKWDSTFEQLKKCDISEFELNALLETHLLDDYINDLTEEIKNINAKLEVKQ